MRDQIVEAIRAAAFVCPGDDCSESEEDCGLDELIVMQSESIIDGVRKTSWISGEVRAIAEVIAHSRCGSCEHAWTDHQEDGCWFTVTTGRAGRNLACPCSIGIKHRTIQEALDLDEHGAAKEDAASGPCTVTPDCVQSP
jgi:hypothetical protein